jgi:hypothetical protein
MFMLEQVVVELLNLVISVYHVPTVSLHHASVLFPIRHFATCPSIIKSTCGRGYRSKHGAAGNTAPRQGAAELLLPQLGSGSHKTLLHVVERSSELEK